MTCTSHDVHIWLKLFHNKPNRCQETCNLKPGSQYDTGTSIVSRVLASEWRRNRTDFYYSNSSIVFPTYVKNVVLDHHECYGASVILFYCEPGFSQMCTLCSFNANTSIVHFVKWMVLLVACHNKQSFIQHNYSSIIVTMLFKLCLFVFSQVDVRLQYSKQQTKESVLVVVVLQLMAVKTTVMPDIYTTIITNMFVVVSHISGRCYLRAMTEAFYPPKVLRFWSGGSLGGELRILQYQ